MESLSAVEKIETKENVPNITIHPNPATEYIYIDSPEDGLLSVYTVLGKLKDNRPLKAGLTPLNITGYENGIYILKAKFATAETSKKIIKQ
jgi:hypothetical protein